MDIADVLGGVKPATRTVRVCLDGTLAQRLDDLHDEWTRAAAGSQGLAPSAEVAGVVDQIRALEADADAATVEFHVASIGAKAWRRLVTEHPPPDGDLEGWRFHPETFPQAALAASCVDPAMSEGDAEQLAERLSNGQWARLWAAVLDVNVGDDIVPKFGPATVAPPTSEPKSTTAPPEASPTASSLASG